MSMARKGSTSLFQWCENLLDRLAAIPYYEDTYILPFEKYDLPSSTPLSSNVQVLWNSFRQGACLCFLVNIYESNTIEDTNQPPFDLETLAEASFSNNSCKSNTYKFLVACRQTLGFDQDQLFSISELYSDQTDGFIKVLHTVENVLKFLEEADRIPRWDSSNSPRESTMLPKKNMSKRQNVIQELLETERKYVGDLDELLNYKNHVESSGIISIDLSSEIFSNLKELTDFQRRFLILLESDLQKEPELQSIGSVFVKMRSDFRCYEAYCANHTKANELIMQHKESLSAADSILEAGYELPSFLIKPIQRLCRYPLIIQELKKATESSWADFIDLDIALDLTKAVAGIVNERKRELEISLAEIDLHNRLEDWKGHDASTFGKLWAEEKLTVLSKGVEKELIVYLFQNILLFCKESSGKLKKKKKPSLNIKGFIYTSSIVKVIEDSKTDSPTLKAFWEDEDQIESIRFRYRAEGLMKDWRDRFNTILIENGREIIEGSPASSARDSGRGLPEEFDNILRLNQADSVLRRRAQSYHSSAKKNRDTFQPENFGERRRRHRSAGPSRLPETPENALEAGDVNYRQRNQRTRKPSDMKRESRERQRSHYSSHARNSSREMEYEGSVKSGHPVSEKTGDIVSAHPNSSPNHDYDGREPIRPQRNRPKNHWKFKVRWHGENHLIVVSDDIGFLDFKSRVIRKLSVSSHGDMENLSLSYEDEDGDLIVINCDEDILEAVHSSLTNTVILYASV